MRIETLYLKNFRNVEEQTFRFNPHFTVLIGINGRGKSTWLHALRVACGSYLLATPETKNRHIAPDEIRLANNGKYLQTMNNVVVEATGSFPELEGPITWRRRTVEGKAGTTSSYEDVGVVRDLGKAKYERMKKGSDDLNLPVIAFFGTSRVHGPGRNRTPRIGRQIFKEGYHSWYEMRSSIFRYDSWLASYDILVKQEKEYPETKAAFFETLKTANPYIREIQFEHGELWLQVAFDDFTSEYLPIHLHSDGIIAFTEMVAELAYRCVVLNGNKRENAIKDTTGVVLIDELDLHLHPNWQRHVVADLKNAFPSIQFVATTHSPFIVQSLEASELINLDRISDVNPSNLTLEEVSTQIMGVEDERSAENFQQENLSKDYLELLEKNASTRSQLLDEIESIISDPAVRAFLQMQRLKQEINP
jgi:predicted ATP-binding protein involved in virulence